MDKKDIPSQIEQIDHALTAPELARWLGFSRAAIYEMTATNRIPHFRIGTSIRYDPQDIADWLRARTVKAA